jgi:hypothetical protein
LWGAVSGAFESVVDVPGGSRLWYDGEHIPFLREDVKDQAEIRQIDASTIETLIRGGFTPDSAQNAVVANDYSLLEATGLVSVQLQPPGSAPEPKALPVTSSNGS